MGTFMPDPSTNTDTSSFTFDPLLMLEESLGERRNEFQLQLQEVESNDLLMSKPSTSLTLPELHDLRSCAEKMNAEGCLSQFINEYVSGRKSVIMFHFHKLWDEKLRVDDIQRLEWELLELKIMHWVRAAHCSFWDIFSCEKLLTEEVFKGLGNVTGQSCFTAIVTDPVTELIDFAEALCSYRRSPERLCKNLVLYVRFSCLASDINHFFGASEEVKGSIRVRADCILSRLAEVVRLTLLDFEATILGDLDNFPLPQGNVHSLTKYVMDYTISVSGNKASLREVIISKPSLVELIISNHSLSSGDIVISESEAIELELRRPLDAHLLWIIIILRLNLERKSKCYQDPSLRSLFMLNNVHYIFQQINGSALLTEIIGENYLNKLAKDVQDLMISYLSGTWYGLLHCLRDEGLNVSWGFTCGSKLSKKALKKRLKTFNTLFGKIHKTQRMWEVPEIELRDELHRRILDHLIPLYRDFLGKFRSHIDRGKHQERYIMYSANELKEKVSGLFSNHSFV